MLNAGSEGVSCYLNARGMPFASFQPVYEEEHLVSSCLAARPKAVLLMSAPTPVLVLTMAAYHLTRMRMRTLGQIRPEMV